MNHTELTFLLELILNHKIPLSTKNLIKERIGLLQQNLPQQSIQRQSFANETNQLVANNAPITIAHTPAVAEALAHRQQAITIAASGVAEKGRTSPRKF